MLLVLCITHHRHLLKILFHQIQIYIRSFYSNQLQKIHRPHYKTCFCCFIHSCSFLSFQVSLKWCKFSLFHKIHQYSKQELSKFDEFGAMLWFQGLCEHTRAKSKVSSTGFETYQQALSHDANCWSWEKSRWRADSCFRAQDKWFLSLENFYQSNLIK